MTAEKAGVTPEGTDELSQDASPPPPDPGDLIAPELAQTGEEEKEQQADLEASRNVNDAAEPATGAPKPEVDYPEGGLQAWLVVFGCWCALVVSLGVLNSFGTLQAYISTHQLSTYSPDAVGWIFSLNSFLTFACGIYIGPIFDKYGPRWVVLLGSVMTIAMLMLLSVCTKYWHFFLTFGILGGLGESLLFTPPFAAVGHWFHRRRGTATGIAAGGGSIGGIVFPLMLERLFGSVGFGWSMRILGFISILLCILANILIRSRLPPAAYATAHPDFRIFRNPTFTLTTMGVFMIEWGLFVPLTYISTYAQHAGFSTAFAYQILPILNASSLFGRWLPGYYADRLGRYNASIAAILLIIVSTLAVWLPAGNTTPGLVVFAVLFGFASGSDISLAPVCVGQLCRTENYGRYYSTCYVVAAVGPLTGVPISGRILQTDGGEYWGLIVFVGMCYVGALVAFVLARGLGGGWKLRVRY